MIGNEFLRSGECARLRFWIPYGYPKHKWMPKMFCPLRKKACRRNQNHLANLFTKERDDFQENTSWRKIRYVP